MLKRRASAVGGNSRKAEHDDFGTIDGLLDGKVALVTGPAEASAQPRRRYLTATPDAQERMEQEVALGRLAAPEEIAEAAAWLLSDRASCGAGAQKGKPRAGALLAVDGGAGAQKGNFANVTSDSSAWPSTFGWKWSTWLSWSRLKPDSCTSSSQRQRLPYLSHA